MDISHITSTRLHETRDKCTHCAEPYRWETIDRVLFTLCPTCRAADLRAWQDRRMVQDDLFRSKPDGILG